ncbi:MAG TPA: helix-turn-helix domain-containing protein [Candidatus Binataceae bacterium]|nr:helix-turn-helix domain-containing protein [Candidatus Binataceae bacterium]
MTKELGLAIKMAREELRMSRQALADRIGIHAAYISYIERGLRRPSIELLNKLAEELGLEAETLVLLAFPELREVLARRIEKKPAKKDDAWERFVSNRALLARHKVSPEEMGILKRVAMLGRVPSVDHFLFVLNAIRQATSSRE